MVRPSGSHEWFYCHGSQLIQQGQPQPDDTATEEGTACHWVAESILRSYVSLGAELLTASDFLGKMSPNNILVDEEMTQGAMMYVMEVLKYCNFTGLIRHVHVEEKIDTSCIYPGSGGTPDSWVYNPQTAELIIWDLKYGFGHVEAYMNPQLLMYIAGILVLLNIDGNADQYLTVKMCIVQPRSYHSNTSVRTWEATAAELRPYFNQLRHAAEQAMSGQGLCTPGLHCRHCKGRVPCPAMDKTLYNYIDVVTGPVPMDLKGQNLVLEWQLLNRIEKLLEYRKSAIDGQINATLESGERLAGVRLAETYGWEIWKKDTSVKNLLALGQTFGADISKPDNLDTPKQALVKIKRAAKKFKVKVDPDLLKPYTVTPFKGFKVVEDDGSEADKVFKK